MTLIADFDPLSPRRPGDLPCTSTVVSCFLAPGVRWKSGAGYPGSGDQPFSQPQPTPQLFRHEPQRPNTETQTESVKTLGTGREMG